MAGETQISTSTAGTRPIKLLLLSDVYREPNADGSFAPRTEAEERTVKGEVAKWASLMGLKK